MEARNFTCRILLISFLLSTTAFSSLKCEATCKGNGLKKKGKLKLYLF